MTREEITERINAIAEPSEQRDELFAVLDELGIRYKKETRCKKCLRDYLLVAKEAVGLVESAAEESDFNGSEPETDAPETGEPETAVADAAEAPKPVYVFTHHRPVLVNGKRYDRFSKQEDLEWLHQRLGNGYAAPKM